MAQPVHFIHTADVHLDTSFSSVGLPSRLGDRKREAIRLTFRRILEQARSQPADLVLIAGDLFEHERVTPDTVEFLKQQFENLGDVPVFLAPGNHDPCIAGSPYREEAWPANVYIFREERFRSVELPHLGVRVTGFGFNRTQMTERHLSRLPVLPADGWNLVLAHGSDVSRVPAGKTVHGPLTIGEIAGKNVHYCALGHYHQQRRLENPIDRTEAWYAGIPEGRGWDEEGERAYLQGTMREGSVEVARIPCGQFPLRSITVDCEGFSTREQIIDAVLQHRGTALDPKTICRIRLQGSPDPRLDLSLAEITERLAEEVLHIEWQDMTQPAIDYHALEQAGTLTGGFVREIAQRMVAAEEEEQHVLELARIYGTQALLGLEVRLR